MKQLLRIGSFFLCSFVLLALCSLTTTPTTAQAQEAVYFAETGHQVSGRFLSYWQQNGGLSVFGYPISDELDEAGQTVQYFERARFEWHPDNQPPYDVLLGRLGAAVLDQRGIAWQEMATSPGPAAGCLWFESTQHNICNQLQNQDIGFLNYWRTHGLEFDGQPDKSYAESVALFGVPITEPYTMNINGQDIQVQWFERARFEWHPDNPAGYRVLLGRLGTRVIMSGAPPPTVSQVALYFVAPGDQGITGPEIGCGDSIIPVEIAIEPTPAPLTAAFERLLNIDSQYYGQSGLYNALYQSDLRLDGASVEQGQATIYLSGNVIITGGVCEIPRFEAQLRRTARQFATVDEVLVYINGQPLENVLSLQ